MSLYYFKFHFKIKVVEMRDFPADNDEMHCYFTDAGIKQRSMEILQIYSRSPLYLQCVRSHLSTPSCKRASLWYLECSIGWNFESFQHKGQALRLTSS